MINNRKRLKSVKWGQFRWIFTCRPFASATMWRAKVLYQCDICSTQFCRFQQLNWKLSWHFEPLFKYSWRQLDGFVQLKKGGGGESRGLKHRKDEIQATISPWTVKLCVQEVLFFQGSIYIFHFLFCPRCCFYSLSMLPPLHYWRNHSTPQITHLTCCFVQWFIR